MEDFKVEIIERLVKVISVRADSPEEAEDDARFLYRNSQIVLTSDDYIDTTINVLTDTKS